MTKQSLRGGWVVLWVSLVLLGGADTVYAQADAAVSDGPGFQSKLLYFLGGFHPAAAHFPVALLLVALPAELLARWRKSEGLAAAGRYCLVIGSIGAIATALLGFCLAGFNMSVDTWGDFERHRLTGTLTAALGVWLLIICCLSTRPNAKKARAFYLMSLVLAAALVALTGFLGGALTHGTDHLSVW